ncbi:hypothetical protein RIM91_27280 [Pseudomonas aeruginosa]|uniref:hypothetical protein n=1 Tax=Pseudomonas aeruginosa TaxID=287 RepID=UPI002E798843|nr:hypothetical protein [Pseudomonas aeruginosa]MEE1712976.1 hypothetical protein [Pseudomonas aeruginosa]
MGRKSSIDKLPPDVRSFIERSLRENRLTLDELIEQLQERFPGKESPAAQQSVDTRSASTR